MGTKKLRRSFPALLGLPLGLALCACAPESGDRGQEENGERESTAAGAEKLAGELPSRSDFELRARFWGMVEAARRVAVKALTAGRVLEVRASDGARVSSRDVLFTLGGPVAEARTTSLEKELEAARTAAGIFREIHETESAAFEKKLATLKAKQEALARFKKAEAELEAAARRVEVHRRSLVVSAPVPGVFCRRRAQVGQDVDPGEVLAEVIDPEALWIEAQSVVEPGRQVASGAGITSKTPARVALPSGSFLETRVSLVHPENLPGGAARFRLEGAEISKSFRAGETVRGSLLLETRRGSLCVPAASVIRDERGRTFVLAIDGSNYERREVRLGLEQEGRVEILSGLSEDEKVVTAGTYRLFHRDFRRLYREED